MAKDKSLDKLIEDVNQKFGLEGAGRPVISKGEFQTPNIIPCSSPMLGWVLATGGWIEGKLHEFFGKEHSAKTSLMFLALKDTYEFYNGERSIALIDIEHRYNEDWAKQLGLPVDELVVVQPPNAEKATDIMHDLIEKHRFAGIGFDSIGAAMPAKEHKTYEEQNAVYAGAAGVMTRNVKTMAPLANYFNTTLYYVNQLREDMEGYHRPVTPGGRAVKHLMSVRLYLNPGKEKYFEKDEKGDEYQVGFQVGFKTVKNSFGPPMRLGATNFFYYPSRYQDHVGFDIENDIQTLGLLTHVFKRDGGWYKYENITSQGREKFFKDLETAGLRDKVVLEIRTKLGMTKASNLVDAPDMSDIDDAEV